MGTAWWSLSAPWGLHRRLWWLSRPGAAEAGAWVRRASQAGEVASLLSQIPERPSALACGGHEQTGGRLDHPIGIHFEYDSDKIYDPNSEPASNGVLALHLQKLQPHEGLVPSRSEDRTDFAEGNDAYNLALCATPRPIGRGIWLSAKGGCRFSLPGVAKGCCRRRKRNLSPTTSPPEGAPESAGGSGEETSLAGDRGTGPGEACCARQPVSMYYPARAGDPTSNRSSAA